MAQAHDVGVLRGDGLHHHAGLNGVLVDGDGLVLRDLLADALLDEVLGHLAQRQAGAARVLLGERHADALPHQAALAGRDGDRLVTLDDGAPVVVRQELVLGDDVLADGVGAEQREGVVEVVPTGAVDAPDVVSVELGHARHGVLAGLLGGEIGLELGELPPAVDMRQQHVVVGIAAVHMVDEALAGHVREDLLALLDRAAARQAVIVCVEDGQQRHLKLPCRLLLGPVAHQHLIARGVGLAAQALAHVVDAVAQVHVHSRDDGAVVEGDVLVGHLDGGEVGKRVAIRGGVDPLRAHRIKLVELGHAVDASLGGHVGVSVECVRLADDLAVGVKCDSGAHRGNGHTGGTSNKTPAGHLHDVLPLLVVRAVSLRASPFLWAYAECTTREFGSAITRRARRLTVWRNCQAQGLANGPRHWVHQMAQGRLRPT